MKRCLFPLIIIAFFISSFLILHIYNQNRVVAKVNEEKITNKDVTNICKQLDDENDYYNKVLNDIIDEYVVVLNADKLNVNISENEIKNYIQEYKTSFPDMYEKGVRLYGKEDLYEGIEMQLIYNKVFEIVVSEQIKNNKEKLIKKFYMTEKEKHDYVMEMSQDEFIGEYQTEFEEYIFDLWIEEMKKDMNIIIY